MNLESEMSQAHSSKTATSQQASTPPSWVDSVLALLSSRVSIIQLEYRDVIRSRTRALSALILGGFFLFFAWILLLTSAIAAIAHFTHWPWYWITLGAAAIHFIAAVIALNIANAPQAPSFPVTRAEFTKDKEWIHSLQKKSTSQN